MACGCRNADNPHHSCTAYCAERCGCSGAGCRAAPPPPAEEPVPEPRRAGSVPAMGPSDTQALFNAFQEAVRDGTKDQVLDCLATAGFPGDFRSPTGRRPLHLVSERGHVDAMNFLLDELGAMLHVVDNKGKSALHYAAKSGNPKAVECVLDRGLDAGGALPELLPDDAAAQLPWDSDDPNGPYGKEIPFHWAIFSHRHNIARLLIDRSGDDRLVDALDNDGETVVHWAAHHGRVGLVRQLVTELGASASARSAHGITALHYAAEGGEMEMVRMLVEEFGAPVDVADGRGNTPLHAAVEFDNREVVDYFLTRPGCPLEKENDEGQTAEDVAAEQRAGPGIAMLLEAAREGRLGEARERIFDVTRDKEKLRAAVEMAKRLTAEG